MEIKKSKTITVEMPIDILATLKQTADEFAQNLRIAAAVKWYENKILSQEKAAEVAGLCREDFIIALGQFKVSVFQYSAEEILKEAGYDTELDI